MKAVKYITIDYKSYKVVQFKQDYYWDSGYVIFFLCPENINFEDLCVKLYIEYLEKEYLDVNYMFTEMQDNPIDIYSEVDEYLFAKFRELGILRIDPVSSFTSGNNDKIIENFEEKFGIRYGEQER